MANTRRCPFLRCKKMIDPSLFACREHWPGIEDEYRFEIWEIYKQYLAGAMHIDDLVRRQGEIMLRITDGIDPRTASKAGPTAGEEGLAKIAERYIAKRKEYSAVKEQNIDLKRKVGMALGKIEKELADACKAILHPQQTQLTLFDAPEEQKMPD